MIVNIKCITFSGILESFTSLGCWKDKVPRAIVDGYEGHTDIQGCFERAKALGNNVFAVQNGKECWTTATAGETYNKYGVTNGCSASGTGGKMANEVYKIGKMYIEQASAYRYYHKSS